MTDVEQRRPEDLSPARQAGSAATAPAAWCFIAALVLGIFSGHWGDMSVPLPLDRVALAATFGCLAWAWLGGARTRLRWHPVHAVMVATVLLAAVSAYAVGTLLDRQSTFALLDRVAVPFVGFVLAPLVLSSPASRRRLVQALTVTGLYVATTAVISVWGPDQLLFPRVLANPYVGIAQGRARGPSAEAVGTGLLVITSGTAAAINAVRTAGVQRAVSSVTVAVCFVAGLLSLTRSIWLAMVLVPCAIALTVPGTRRRLSALGVGAVAAVVVLLASVPGLAAAMVGRLGTSRSLDDRAYTNDAAVDMLLQHPLTGVGWGRFTTASPDYIFQSDTAPLTNVGIEVHNVFLSRGAELGVPGLLLTVAVVLLGPVLGLLGRRAEGFPDATDIKALAVAAVVAWVSTALVTGLSFAFANLLAWSIAGLAFAQRDTWSTAPAAATEVA